MHEAFKTYLPENFHTINGYLFLANPAEMIEFYQKVFYAEELSRTIRQENGEIQNCILRVGDSIFMISQAAPPFMDMRTCFYLYVADVDAIYHRALEEGGVSVFEPADMDFGDRQGGIMDPAGNYWWISKRLVRQGY
jgi:PhnB protein